MRAAPCCRLTEPDLMRFTPSDHSHGFPSSCLLVVARQDRPLPPSLGPGAFQHICCTRTDRGAACPGSWRGQGTYTISEVHRHEIRPARDAPHHTRPRRRSRRKPPAARTAPDPLRGPPFEITHQLQHTGVHHPCPLKCAQALVASLHLLPQRTCMGALQPSALAEVCAAHGKHLGVRVDPTCSR